MSYHQLAAANATRNTLQLNMNNMANMRSDSQLSFNSQTKPIYEERHYQNIQLYQLNPQRTASPTIGGSVSQLPPSSTLSQQSLIIPSGANRTILHGSHSSLQPQAQEALQTMMSRPVSALVTSREQEQIFPNSVAFTSLGTPTSVTPRKNQVMQTVSSGLDFFNYPQPGQIRHMDPRQRDLMRQEAKMEEIREELRRREDRIQQQHQPNSYLGTIPRGMSMSNSVINPMPPPSNTTSIRPNRLLSQQALPNGVQLLGGNHSQSTGTLRMPSQLNQTRSVQPPPPAPKPSRPAATQQTQLSVAPTKVSYRYGPSGYPPPMVSSKSTNFNTPTTGGRASEGIASPSPWEREEKEKVMQY